MDGYWLPIILVALGIALGAIAIVAIAVWSVVRHFIYRG